MSVSSCEGTGGFESSPCSEPMSSIITRGASFCLGTLRPRNLPSTLPASMSTCPGGEKPGVSPDPDLGRDGHRMTAIPARAWSRAARTENEPVPRQGGDLGRQWPKDQSPVIPFIQRQNWTRATGHSWNLQTVWQILTHFMASPMVLSTTQSHDFMETEAALAFTPHSNCGGDQPLLPPGDSTQGRHLGTAIL